MRGEGSTALSTSNTRSQQQRFLLGRVSRYLFIDTIEPDKTSIMSVEAFTISRSKLTGPRKKTILITGGSAGIGLQTATLLHDLGNNVVVLDRAPAPKSLSTSSRFLYQQCDITSWQSQRGAFEAAVKKFGGIDGVFVNAGIAEYKDQFFRDEVDSTGLLAEPDRRVLVVDMNAASDTDRKSVV